MDIWIYECKDGRMEGWKDGRMEGCRDVAVDEF
jgi:hypothetical protein